MRRILLLLLLATPAFGAALPGFRVQLLGTAAGFLSSVAVDSRGVIYYTTVSGNLFRLETGGTSTRIAHVTTDVVGNSGLLGMALRDDRTAVIHYTTPSQVADVVAAIDLTTGDETIIASLVADLDFPPRGSPGEHHGGNPTVAADGSIFVAVGDYGGGFIASLPDWNGGKIFRIFPDGRVEKFARGVRNPFDMSWDAANQRLIVPDNGDLRDDEINVTHAGDNLGWPFTMGSSGPEIEGAVRPVFTFPNIVAPTGFTAVSGANPMLRRGYLLTTFVTRSLLYIADVDARPFPEPLTLIKDDLGMLIDVVEAPDGTIVIGSGNAIYRLFTPTPGDCNGDGIVNYGDFTALEAVLEPSAAAIHTADNATRSWGCDVNTDGVVDARDISALVAALHLRTRAVRR
jgi:glucose/arabinose dehydrogenase